MHHRNLFLNFRGWWKLRAADWGCAGKHQFFLVLIQRAYENLTNFLLSSVWSLEFSSFDVVSFFWLLSPLSTVDLKATSIQITNRIVLKLSADYQHKKAWITELDRRKICYILAITVTIITHSEPLEQHRIATDRIFSTFDITIKIAMFRWHLRL